MTIPPDIQSSLDRLLRNCPECFGAQTVYDMKDLEWWSSPPKSFEILRPPTKPCPLCVPVRSWLKETFHSTEGAT